MQIQRQGVRFYKAIRRCGHEFLQIVRSGLFLPRCRICGLDLVSSAEKVICRNCCRKMTPDTATQCRVCGKFIPQGVATCGACLLEPPPFERHVSYAAYEGTLRDTIILFKYGEVEPLKHWLAGLYLEAVEKKLPGASFAAVVPVPADRKRRRGFQPVRTTGYLLARRLKIPFQPGLLIKKKSTPPQVGLTQAQRQANLDGAFALARGKKVAGLRILLIDDVTTTGTTIRKCAAILKKGGARVTVVTLAQSRL
jgi:competence protein ComFC